MRAKATHNLTGHAELRARLTDAERGHLLASASSVAASADDQADRILKSRRCSASSRAPVASRSLQAVTLLPGPQPSR